MIVVWQVLISGIFWVGIAIGCAGYLTLEAVNVVSSGGIRHMLLSRFKNMVASDMWQFNENSEPLP